MQGTDSLKLDPAYYEYTCRLRKGVALAHIRCSI